jgi:hypothetical protein
MGWLYAGSDLSRPDHGDHGAERPLMRSERLPRGPLHAPHLACVRTCRALPGSVAPNIKVGADINWHPPDDRLFGTRLTPGTGIGKPEPRSERPDGPEAGNIGAARRERPDFLLAKTHLSRGFRWYA